MLSSTVASTLQAIHASVRVSRGSVVQGVGMVGLAAPAPHTQQQAVRDHAVGDGGLVLHLQVCAGRYYECECLSLCACVRACFRVHLSVCPFAPVCMRVYVRMCVVREC